MTTNHRPLPPELRTSLAEVLARADVWRGDAGLIDLAAVSLPKGIPFSHTPMTEGNSCGNWASGFAALDAQLPGGGWPRGQLVELLSAGSGIGELSVLMPLLAQCAQADKRIALIMPPDCGWQPCAPAWDAAAGVTQALLVVRPNTARDALWATVQCLRCPGIAATLSWLEDGLRTGLTQRTGRSAQASLTGNSLRRLQLAAGEGGGGAFLFRPLECAGQASPAPLRLVLAPLHGGLQIELIKRRGTPASRPIWLSLPRPLSLERIRHALVCTDSAAAGTQLIDSTAGIALASV